MRFRDQVVAVTGGGSGIGQAACLKFAGEGARVAVIDVNAGAARTTVSLIAANGGEALAVAGDVADEAQVAETMRRIVDAFGTIHVLANVAAKINPKTIEAITSAEWDELFRVNARGVFLCCKYAIAEIKKNKGKIVNVASMNGLVGQKGNIAYAATKGAVIALTKALAVDYAQQGVRVNAVCPAGVATPLIESWLTSLEDPDRARREQELSHLLGYIAKPEEIADTILFLASDQSSFITGQAIQIEGGATLGYGSGPKAEWTSISL